jgi:hypothetical protein
MVEGARQLPMRKFSMFGYLRRLLHLKQTSPSQFMSSRCHG